MTAVTHERSHVTMSDRMHVRRSRGALSGILLVLLGAWGALIPFVGPYFDYAYTPNSTWAYTDGRLWLHILPGVATALGGLMLLLSSNRLMALAGGWIAAVAGLWFCVGPVLSTLWNDGVSAAGVPVGTSTVRTTVEQIGFFAGLGAVIIFFAAVAIGRLTVVGVSDLRRTDKRQFDDRTQEDERREHVVPTQPQDRGEYDDARGPRTSASSAAAPTTGPTRSDESSTRTQDDGETVPSAPVTEPRANTSREERPTSP